MNEKNLKILFILTSMIQSVLWICGLLFANIWLILAAIVVVLIILPLVYRHKDEISGIFQGKDIMEDERTELINEKSSTLTLGVVIATILYVGLIIVSLRNSYPDLQLAGYTLFATAVFALIINVISRIYYKRRY
ncbi:MAG: DUF2178 domain-containing protein [Methanobacterium sp. ERen5]|nr:MAG: DUF2178 domain-containing protein [Methanobacterium sp. ERen5]